MSSSGFKYLYGPVPSRRLGRSLGIDLVPFNGISFGNMVDGLIAFTDYFPGQVWLEVLLISGVTGMAADVEKIAALAKKLAQGKCRSIRFAGRRRKSLPAP